MKKHIIRLLLVLALSLLLAGMALAHEADCPCAEGAAVPEAKTYSSDATLALTEDLSLSGDIEITGGTVNLCLNGHLLNLNTNQIKVTSGAALNIYGCGGTATLMNNAANSTIDVIGGTLHIYGGNIANTSASGGRGQAIGLEGGSFALHGGTIMASQLTTVSVNGAAACVIEGGTIINTAADGVAVGLETTASVTVKGGTISSQNGYGITVPQGKVLLSGAPDFSTCDTGIYLMYPAARLGFDEYTGAAIEVEFLKSGVLGAGIPAGSVIVEGLADETAAIRQAGYVTVVDSNGNRLLPVKNNNDKWDLQLSNHPCSYTYSAGTTGQLLQSCADCDHQGSYTISAPTDGLVYDGTTKHEVTAVADAWVGDLPTLSYTKNSASETDTTGAGNYVATITAGGKSASVSYTVAKARQNVTIDLRDSYDLSEGSFPGPYLSENPKDGATVTYSILAGDDVATLTFAVTPDNRVIKLNKFGSFTVQALITETDNYEGATLTKTVQVVNDLSLITSNLHGATASLSKTEKLALDEFVILTVTPEEGAEFVEEFGVKLEILMKYSVIAEDESNGKQEDGSYRYKIQYKGDDSFSVSGLTRFVKPDPALVAVDYINETVTFPAGYELNTNDAFDGTAVSSGDSISAWLELDSGSLRFRRAAADGIAAGDTVAVGFTRRPALRGGEGYTMDFKTGTATALEGYELSGDDGATWGDSLSNLDPSDWFRVRKTATATTPQSRSASVYLPDTPVAPALTAKAESVRGENDGEIAGFETGVAYEKQGENGWEAVTPTEGKLTGLAPGEYAFRRAATDTAFAGAPIQLRVLEGEPRSYTLTLSISPFPAMDYGDLPNSNIQYLSIKNEGNSPSEILSMGLRGPDADAFRLSNFADLPLSLQPGGESRADFELRPEDGLDAGSYEATVYVTYTDGGEATADVSLTVNKLPQDAPEAPELEGATAESIILKPMNLNANGAKVQYRVNAGPWQDSSIFEGLNPKQEYVFEARYGELANYEASAPSESVMFATEAAPETPAAPAEVPGTGDSGQPALWLGLLCLAGLSLPLVFRKRKEH